MHYFIKMISENCPIQQTSTSQRTYVQVFGRFIDIVVNQFHAYTTDNKSLKILINCTLLYKA